MEVRVRSGVPIRCLKVMEGAKEAGTEVEFVNLYDYEFKCCRSCFACKLKNAKTNGLCAIRDDLRPVLEKALNANVIVIGSPVYFYFNTGVSRSVMEHLMFPVLTYNPKVNEAGEMEQSLLKRTVPDCHDLHIRRSRGNSSSRI